MQLIHQLSFYLHILFGSAALVLFWLPIASAKGSLDHKKFGRFYHATMYAVAATGAVMAVIVLYAPFLIHGDRLSDLGKIDLFNHRMRVFYGLLLFLSLLIYVGLRHGDLALKSKTDKTAVKTPLHLASNGLLFLGGVALLVSGINNQHTLSLVFCFLGMAAAIGNLRFCLGSKGGNQQWLIEHLSSYIGTGIGAYTAFFAFGGRSLFGDIGQWHLVFWILPGVLGSFVIRHYSKKYTPRPLSNSSFAKSGS